MKAPVDDLGPRHEFQFGVRLRYESLETLNDQQISQGELDYNNVSPTALYDLTSGTVTDLTLLPIHVNYS